MLLPFVFMIDTAQQADLARAGDWVVSMLYGRATRPPSDLCRWADDHPTNGACLNAYTADLIVLWVKETWGPITFCAYPQLYSQIIAARPSSIAARFTPEFLIFAPARISAFSNLVLFIVFPFKETWSIKNRPTNQ
jgi:hypothetical protein